MKELKVGLQLYSVRDEMKKDMDACLEAVKEMGYDYVEFANFFEKSADEIIAMLEKYDLKCVSVHGDIKALEENPCEYIEYLKKIGIKYFAIPHYGIGEYRENWEETIEKFGKIGNLLDENDMKLLYHNHSFEFEKKGEDYIFDRLFVEVPSENFAPQMDTCWVHYGGENHAEYIKKYADKIDVIHYKDFVCENLASGPIYGLSKSEKESVLQQSRTETGFKNVPLGKGLQNWKEITDAVKESNVEYIIIELDNSSDNNPMEDAKQSREYLKNNFGI